MAEYLLSADRVSRIALDCRLDSIDDRTSNAVKQKSVAVFGECWFVLAFRRLYLAPVTPITLFRLT